MSEFAKLLSGGGIIVFDGAMGTVLQERGLAPGESPELFGLRRPEAVREVHAQYVAAGARVITTNTFGANRYKLPKDVSAFELCREMGKLARQAAGERALVAGSIGPTGQFAEPLGKLTRQAMIESFEEQVRGLCEAGVDLLIGETHFDLAEAQAVAVAVRRVCKLPLAMCMTYESGLSLTGSSPAVFAQSMGNLGVELIGANCGMGPAEMAPILAEYASCFSGAFLVKPNAGMPRLENGRTVFPMGPDEFAQLSLKFVDLGAKALSGCCGTTPAHIQALVRALGERSWQKPAEKGPRPLALTSRTELVLLGADEPGKLIGERINPTGKKQLTAELQSGHFNEALRLALEQVECGAGILDVNVGAPMVDEQSVLPALVKHLLPRLNAPLCLDSNSIAALAQGLAVYPGSALVNSISGEPGRLEELAPLCKLYGAPVILLPLSGKQLPESADDRIASIEKLLDKLLEQGIPKHMILADVLALTVSSRPEAARQCLETIRRCREDLGIATVLGLSNISFGLPARELLNQSFLTMCLAAGLSAYIANPGSAVLREAQAAANLLLAKDPQANAFIAGYASWTPQAGAALHARSKAGQGQQSSGAALSLREAVVAGKKEDIAAMLDRALASGAEPAKLLDDELIPGIMDVGEKYERREYFLPQLLLSAETMRLAFAKLSPLLGKGGEAAERPKIVLATVEGDVHDIGKNIVALLLGNHGFEVIDLGKDVACASIVEAARESGASLIGLSALMTTTMVRMREVVELVKESGLPLKVMVGGAVVTEAYAKSIGAHGYAADAVAAVRLAKSLL